MLDDAKLINEDYNKKKITGTQFVVEDKTYAIKFDNSSTLAKDIFCLPLSIQAI